MPKQKNVHLKRTPSPQRIGVVALDESQPLEERDEAQEADILASLDAPEEGVEYQIRVFQLENKANGGNAREVYLFSCEKEMLPELWDKLRDTYGTGQYRVRVRKMGVGFNYQIHQMDRAVKSLAGIPQPPAAQTTQPATQSAVDQRLERIELALQQRAAPSPALDIVQMFGLFEKMSARLAPATAPAAAPALDPTSAMEIWKQGLQFAQEIGAPAEKGVMDIVASFLQSGVVEKVLSALPTRAPAAAAAHGAPQPQPQQLAAPPVSQQYMTELLNQIGSFADQRLDPAKAAEFVFENVPMGTIRDLVEDPSMIDQMALAVPVVAKNRGYFVALRSELEKQMMADNDDPTDSETVAPGEPAVDVADVGDARDAQMDARANPPRQTQRRRAADFNPAHRRPRA